jgi:hypothetical protein
MRILDKEKWWGERTKLYVNGYYAWLVEESGANAYDNFLKAVEL